MSVSFRAERDDVRRKVVIKIEISDHDLVRNHLVPIDTAAAPVALADYVLHCLRVVDAVRRDKYASAFVDFGLSKRAESS